MYRSQVASFEILTPDKKIANFMISRSIKNLCTPLKFRNSLFWQGFRENGRVKNFTAIFVEQYAHTQLWFGAVKLVKPFGGGTNLSNKRNRDKKYAFPVILQAIPCLTQLCVYTVLQTPAGTSIHQTCHPRCGCSESARVNVDHLV